MEVVDKAFADLTPSELYAILRLRVDVFVVEQECPYPELDGRDLEPATRHLWVPGDVTHPHGEPSIAAYLRVLRDADAVRIGRVVTHPGHRNNGIGAALFRAAVDAHPGERIDIDAQAHLADWYARFGFERTGDVFLEDGIPHVAMVRPADAEA